MGDYFVGDPARVTDACSPGRTTLCSCIIDGFIPEDGISCP